MMNLTILAHGSDSSVNLSKQDNCPVCRPLTAFSNWISSKLSKLTSWENFDTDAEAPIFQRNLCDNDKNRRQKNTSIEKQYLWDHLKTMVVIKALKFSSTVVEF